MYVAFENGGKQYRAQVNQCVVLEKMEYSEKGPLEFSGVSFTGTSWEPVKITATPLGIKKAQKVIIFRKNRRHNFRRKKGHRQPQLHVRIEKITAVHAVS